jgi:hypothetical protein
MPDNDRASRDGKRPAGRRAILGPQLGVYVVLAVAIASICGGPTYSSVLIGASVLFLLVVVDQGSFNAGYTDGREDAEK